MTNVQMPNCHDRAFSSFGLWASFVLRHFISCRPAAWRIEVVCRLALVVHFSFSIFCATLRRMRRAIYPGSFDPVTNGHVDIVERARKLFDEVIVAVAANDEKQPLFSLRERLDLLRRTVGRIDNVRIAQFKGLLVEFANAEKAGAVIRGLRAVSDFEFEFQMALMNRKLNAVVETIFLMPKEEYTYLSSRIVKEIARLGGDVSSFVPAFVVTALNRKFDR
jgi:pantetheine-phosphate adenylyltransferase